MTIPGEQAGQVIDVIATALVPSQRNVCLEHVLSVLLIFDAPITLAGKTNVREPVPSWQTSNAISWPTVALVVLRVELETLPVKMMRKFCTTVAAVTRNTGVAEYVVVM